MTTRHELPWHNIRHDVLAAIDAFNQQRPFVNCWNIGSHIFSHPEDYPAFAGVAEDICRSRVCIVVRKLGWRRYNRVHGKRSPVFVDPRVRV